MIVVNFKYSIGYGSHRDEMEFEDDVTDQEIEDSIREFVMERLDWVWEKEQGDQ